jgi:Asp-tRNA(Asn)/Glu-tRNA(Gln) amidotransferase A subunit family amidase
MALQASLDRLSILNESYRAFSHLAQDVLEVARQLDEECRSLGARSPIHGLTVSVKGNIPVARLPWTEGSAIFENRIAEMDANIIRKIRQAGGVILGITTLSELAMYAVENPFEPMGLNPWDVQRTAGGSSTGAGVAATLCLAEINVGTDSGGSIRNPACHCGCVGFMPSMGTVNTEGIPNHTPSLSNVGWITRSVGIARATYQVLRADSSIGLFKGRLVLPSRLIEQMCDAASLQLFGDVIRRMKLGGLELIEHEIEGWLDGERAAGIVSLFESGQALSRMDLSKASSTLGQRVSRGGALDHDDVLSARRTMKRFKHAFEEALEKSEADAVLTPTWPFAAPLLTAETVQVRDQRVSIDPHRNCFVRTANAAGACAVTLPSGFYVQERVPAGIQLMGAAGRESTLLTLAATIEALLPRLPMLPLAALAVAT